jgi:hypothetical protein
MMQSVSKSQLLFSIEIRMILKKSYIISCTIFFNFYFSIGLEVFPPILLSPPFSIIRLGRKALCSRNKNVSSPPFFNAEKHEIKITVPHAPFQSAFFIQSALFNKFRHPSIYLFLVLCQSGTLSSGCSCVLRAASSALSLISSRWGFPLIRKGVLKFNDRVEGSLWYSGRRKL